MWEVLWLVRLAHILAAAVWVGGSVMYQIVVLPALRCEGPAPAIAARIAALFKQVTNICVGALLLTGVYLTFDRLATTTLGTAYIVVLALKIVLALALFALAFYLGQSSIRRIAKRTTRFSQSAPRLMLVLGILVFALGALLNTLFELMNGPY